MEKPLEIFVDGSFDPTSATGGWAVVVTRTGEEDMVVVGTCKGKSNNTFEVLSVVEAIVWLETNAPGASAVVWTDSAHVVEGYEYWRTIWRGNGWKRVTANSQKRRRSIPDAAMWQKLDQLLLRNPGVGVQLCKGHSGISGNEKADKGARSAASESPNSSGACVQ